MATSFAKRLSSTLTIILLASSPASAEWQFKPFVGLTFAGDTTFLVDFEQVVGGKNLVIGGNATWLGPVVGIEGDFGYGPGFFEGGDDLDLVRNSSVVTFTGNVVLAFPRSLTEYTLRPYFVGGAGLMRVKGEDVPVGDLEPVFRTSSTLGCVDFGGGITGFLTERIGLNWDVRWFKSVGGEDKGLSVNEEALSFWRATMAVAVRY